MAPQVPRVGLPGKFAAMEVRVLSPDMLPLLVPVERSSTVLELKKRIHARLSHAAQHTPPNNLRLRLAPPAGADASAGPGRLLDNRRTLGASGVRPGTSLQLTVPVRVTVRPLGAGADVEVWADRYAPIADLRTRAQRALRRPTGSPELVLMVDGRLLDPTRTLAAYRLANGALLAAVVPSPAESAFGAARAALAELAAAALAGVEEAVVRPTPPLNPRPTAEAHAEAARRFGAAGATEQAAAFAAAHAALGRALDALAPLRRSEAALRAELAELAAADAVAAAQLRAATVRARQLLSAARDGLSALEALADGDDGGSL